MDKKNKIFHKSEEGLPSADDILNYLSPSKDTNSPAPSLSASVGPQIDSVFKKSSEVFNESEESLKMEGEENHFSNERKSKASPKKKINKNSKKEHALEKAMLSEPLVLEAVQGFEAFEAKERLPHVLDSINKEIATKSKKKKDRVVFFRIASMALLALLISGVSFYLFDVFTGDQIAKVSVSPENVVKTETKGLDSVQASSVIKDTLNSLAIETNKGVSTQNDLPLPETINSDAGVQKETKTGAVPKIEDEFTTNDSDKKGEEKAPAIERSMVPTGSIERGFKEDEKLSNEEDLIELEETSVGSKDERKVVEKSTLDSRSSAKKKVKANRNYAPTYSDTYPKEITTVERSYTLTEGIEYYNQADYKKAKEIMIGVLQKQPKNQEAFFYLGMSEKNQADYSQALVHLSKIDKKSKRFDEARWNMAMIYIELNNTSEAKKILKEISTQNSTYSSKALEELRKLGQ